MEDNNENVIEYSDGAKYIAKEYNDNDKYLLNNSKLTVEQCGAAALSYILCAFGDTVTANYYFPWSLEKFNPTDKIGNLIKAGSLITLAIDKYYQEDASIIDVERSEDSMAEKLKQLQSKLNKVNNIIKDSYKIDEEIDKVSDNTEDVTDNIINEDINQ